MLRLAWLSALLLAASHLWAADSASPQTLRYTILSNGKTAGSEVDVNPGDHIDYTFEFNDGGRGPKVAAHYTVAADGSPLRVDETGNDYLKAPVDEHFAVENGIAVWKSTSENGEAPAPGFYISNNGASVEWALLVDALLRAKGVPVKLLPAGEARLERLTDVTLEDHGRKLHVTEFAITGLRLRCNSAEAVVATKAGPRASACQAGGGSSVARSATPFCPSGSLPWPHRERPCRWQADGL